MQSRYSWHISCRSCQSYTSILNVLTVVTFRTPRVEGCGRLGGANICNHGLSVYYVDELGNQTAASLPYARRIHVAFCDNDSRLDFGIFARSVGVMFQKFYPPRPLYESSFSTSREAHETSHSPDHCLHNDRRSASNRRLGIYQSCPWGHFV